MKNKDSHTSPDSVVTMVDAMLSVRDVSMKKSLRSGFQYESTGNTPATWRPSCSVTCFMMWGSPSLAVKRRWSLSPRLQTPAPSPGHSSTHCTPKPRLLSFATMGLAPAPACEQDQRHSGTGA